VTVILSISPSAFGAGGGPFGPLLCLLPLLPFYSNPARPVLLLEPSVLARNPAIRKSREIPRNPA
jgi:hypothetical protein